MERTAARCASTSDRYEWSMAHLDVSPRAQKLPRPELEQIVKVVVDATSSTVLLVRPSLCLSLLSIVKMRACRHIAIFCSQKFFRR